MLCLQPEGDTSVILCVQGGTEKRSHFLLLTFFKRLNQFARFLLIKNQ